MRPILGIISLAALLAVHATALYDLLHPNVSREYRAYYIDRTSTDWHVPHYSATPEEGIDLAKSEWPDFVVRSYGMLKAEPFGRWTDTRYGLRSGFEFDRSFSGPACVALEARPYDSQRTRGLTLAFGDEVREVDLPQSRDMGTYVYDFALGGPANTLELRFPRPLPRVSPDNPRQVGVAWKSVRILPGTCSIQRVIPSRSR